MPRVTLFPAWNQMDIKWISKGRRETGGQDSADSRCVVLALFPAYAQAHRKNEIGLLLGAPVTPGLEVAGSSSSSLKIGSGLTFQLTYARQLTTTRSVALYFEVPALAIPLQDITASNGAVPANYDSFFVTPALRVKLDRSARVSPWFSVGGGYALFDESASRIEGTHNITARNERKRRTVRRRCRHP